MHQAAPPYQKLRRKKDLLKERKEKIMWERQTHEQREWLQKLRALTGYHLKSVGPHSFSCQKLGQISVRIYSKENTEEPFPSALLSLSGENGYRNNSITEVGGYFIFTDLFTGSFYLRPLLKEYVFSPRAQAIELGSGEAREVIFEATRVAYRFAYHWAKIRW